MAHTNNKMIISTIKFTIIDVYKNTKNFASSHITQYF